MVRQIIQVLVLMTAIILTQTRQDDLTLTDSILFHQNGHILAECPDNTLQIEFSSNCTDIDECPEFAPFLFKSVCLSFCPIGYGEMIGSCHKDKASEGQVEKTNLICQTGFCPSNKPLCDEYQCVRTCSQGKFIEEQSCVYTCSNQRPNIINNTCVATCPLMYPYTEDNHCVLDCSTGHVLHGNICVKACPQGKYRTRTKCVDSCQSEGMLELVVWNTRLCLDKCPVFTNNNDTICNIQCPRASSFLWNMSCVSQCPDTMPFVYVLSKRLPLYKTAVCLSFCPDWTYIDGRTCVDKCRMGMNIDNGKCVQHCPASRQYVYQGMCISKCPLKYALYDTSCVQSCPSHVKYTFNGTCLESCPSGYKILLDNCVYKCPSEFILFHGACSERCPAGMFAFSGSCVDQCPITHPYRGIKQVQSTNTSFTVETCLKTCVYPTPLLYNETCVDTCPINTFVINYTCVANCSNIGMLSYGDRCVDECPYSYSYNGVCRSCPKHASIIFNNTCVERCPATHTLYLPVDYVRTMCVNSCSRRLKWSVYRPLLLESNRTCVRECPMFTYQFQESCVEKCPLRFKMNTTADSHAFVYYKKSGQNVVRYCVDDCPGGTYSIDNKCFDHCPESLVSFNRSCLQKCPATHRFRFMHSSDEKSFRCEQTCFKDHFIYKDQCLPKCPEQEAYSQGQTCLSKCGSSYPFFDPLTKECIKYCQQPYVILNGTCKQSCSPELRFLVNNVCTNACPLGMKLWSLTEQGNVCSNACTDQFVKENNTCVPRCANDHVIINNECTGLKFCPWDYKYSAKSVHGRVCLKTCPKGQFISASECVVKCNLHYVNNECVDRCPETHPFTKTSRYPFNISPTECYKKCPSSQFAEGHTCVSSCSSNLYIANNNTCVKQCPPDHPFKRIEPIAGAACTKTCGDSYLVDSNNTCVAREPNCMLKYKNRCVKICPTGFYPDVRKKMCISLTDLIAGLTLMFISLTLFLCVCCLLKRRKPSFQVGSLLIHGI